MFNPSFAGPTGGLGFPARLWGDLGLAKKIAKTLDGPLLVVTLAARMLIRQVQLTGGRSTACRPMPAIAQTILHPILRCRPAKPKPRPAN